jgi:hypothetical protein
MAKKRTTSGTEAKGGTEAKPKKAAAGGAKKATKAAKAAGAGTTAGAAKKAAAPKGAAKAAKGAKAAGAADAAPKKKAAPVKLTDKQRELLQKIQGAGEVGYKAEKAEGRGLNGLKEKKLIKSVRNKETKDLSAVLTKAGEKALAPPKA